MIILAVIKQETTKSKAFGKRKGHSALTNAKLNLHNSLLVIETQCNKCNINLIKAIFPSEFNTYFDRP